MSQVRLMRRDALAEYVECDVCEVAVRAEAEQGGAGHPAAGRPGHTPSTLQPHFQIESESEA